MFNIFTSPSIGTASSRERGGLLLPRELNVAEQVVVSMVDVVWCWIY